MGQLVFILGRSGTGKSYSLRNFPKNKLAVINVQGKVLPFKGSAAIEQTATDNSANILKALDIYSQQYKAIVVDDYQYVMSNEFMRRSAEKGYDKFTEIARHAWDVANKVRELPMDVIVYIMCHTDMDDQGNEKIKTIGKLLDEKICLEGLSTIVLKTNVSDGQYTFLTQNSGKDTVKSPAGMFPTYAIDNDLWYVDQKIRTYYEMDGAVSDEAMTAMDQTVAKPDVEKPEVGRRRRRSTEPKTDDSGSVASNAPADSTTDTLTDEDVIQLQTDVSKTLADIAFPKEEPTQRRQRKVRNGQAQEEKLAEAPTEEAKEAAETTAGERENRRNTRRPSDNRNNYTRDDGASEEAAVEQPAHRRRRRRAEAPAPVFEPIDDVDAEDLPF